MVRTPSHTPSVSKLHLDSWLEKWCPCFLVRKIDKDLPSNFQKISQAFRITSWKRTIEMKLSKFFQARYAENRSYEKNCQSRRCSVTQLSFRNLHASALDPTFEATIQQMTHPSCHRLAPAHTWKFLKKRISGNILVNPFHFNLLHETWLFGNISTHRQGAL